MCKCGIMKPQNESARLPGTLPGSSAPSPGASPSRGHGNWAAGSTASLPGGEGLQRMGSGGLSVIPAPGWGSWPTWSGPEAGQVGTNTKVRWENPAESCPQTLLYSAT